jgi:hypothetical protein
MPPLKRTNKTPARYKELLVPLSITLFVLILFMIIMNVGMFRQRNPIDKKFWFTIIVRNIIGVTVIVLVIWGIYTSITKSDEVV